MDINSCTPFQEGKQPIFKSVEKGCEHIGKNVNRHGIRHFKVDGEVFSRNSAEVRCDYLLLNDTDKRAYYIELKGSDIEKAIQQIENSIRLLHSGIQDYRVYPRIIYHSRTLDTQGSKAQKWKIKYRGKAIIHSRKLEENIS